MLGKHVEPHVLRYKWMIEDTCLLCIAFTLIQERLCLLDGIRRNLLAFHSDNSVGKFVLFQKLIKPAI